MKFIYNIEMHQNMEITHFVHIACVEGNSKRVLLYNGLREKIVCSVF